MKLLIAAGGTGGHIFPGIAVAEAFGEEGAGEVIFAGTPYGLEERLIPKAGYRLVKIEARPFSGGSPGAKVRTLMSVLKGTGQALALIRAERPDAVLGMGAFTSVPVILAALLSRVPCFTHEQNVSPGIAIRLLARRVRTTFVSFSETARYLKGNRTVHTGNPIRKTLRGKREAKTEGPFTVLAFGGSRGARAINEAVLGLLPYLDNGMSTTLFHQTGAEDFDRVSAAYGALKTAHEVFPFTDRMEIYYNLADIAISRAGASAIFELSYFRKPAVFVPYPYAAGGHQSKNAEYVASLGGARTIGNSEISGEVLARALKGFREDPGGLARMAERIGAVYVEDAEKKVVRGMLESVS